MTTKIRLKEFGLLPRTIILRLKARQETKTITQQVKKSLTKPVPQATMSDEEYAEGLYISERISCFDPTLEDIYNLQMGKWESSVDAALDEIEKSVAKLPEKDREVQARILWKDQRHQYKKPTLIYLWHEDVTAEDMDAESEWDEFKNLMKSRDERLKEELDWIEETFGGKRPGQSR